MIKYKIISGQSQLDLELDQKTVAANGAEASYKVLHADGQKAVIRLNNKIFTVRILAEEEDSKSVTASLNGQTTQVELKSETDLLLEKMGGNGSKSASAKSIKAPMPGLIVKIHLSLGDQVEKGQPILNFEAMKMENQLKSPGSGKIKNILVSTGDKVEKGQLLVELE